MKILIALAIALSIYSAIGVTYIFVSNYLNSENARITMFSENQQLMSPIECYKLH